MKTINELRNELSNGIITEERYSARIWVVDKLFKGDTIKELLQFKDNINNMEITAHLDTWASFRESQMSRALGIANGERTEVINQIVLTEALCLSFKGMSTDCGRKYSEETVEAIYYQAMKKGIVCGNEVLYPAIASAGQVKKGHAYGFSAETLRNFRELFECGGISWEQFNGVAESKRQQYKALIATGSAPASRYGFNWSADDMIIVKDQKVTIKGEFRKCFMQKDYAIEDTNEVKVTPTDGVVLVIDPSFRGLAAQARPFGGKGMMYYSDIRYAEQQGYSLVVKDIWGKEHNIKEEGVKIIAFESAMKTARRFKSLDEFRAHCKAAAAEGFNEVAFCAAPKSKSNLETKTLGRQLVQTLRGITKDQILSIAKHQLDKLAELETLEGLKKTLANQSNNVGLLANTLPGFEETTLAYTIGKELFDSQFKGAANCRIGKAVFEYIVPDDIAIQDVLFGGKDANEEQVGVLEANTISMKNVKIDSETEVVMGRYPCNGDKLRVVTFVRNLNTNRWFSTNCQYCSYNDANVYFVDGDFDGDEAVITIDPIVVGIVKKLNAEIKPIIHELGEADIEKRPDFSNKGAARQYAVKARAFGFLYGNVGIVANTIAKSFAYDGDINHIAALATQHQAVIDSTKTYVPARPVGKDVTKAIMKEVGPFVSSKPGELKLVSRNEKPMPWCQRFNKSEDTEKIKVDGKMKIVKHAWDDEKYWAGKHNIATKPVDCIVDNVPVTIIEDRRNSGKKDHYDVKWDRKEANWLLCAGNYEHIETVKVNSAVAAELKEKYKDDKFATKWLNNIDNSGVVPFDVFFSFVISKTKNTVIFNDEEDNEEANDKYAKIRKIMRIAVGGAGEECDQDVLSTLILDYFCGKRNTAELTSSWKGAHWFQRNIIECYGDLMAKNCEIKLAALAEAEKEEEDGEEVDVF